jgi:hypothetical protein
LHNNVLELLGVVFSVKAFVSLSPDVQWSGSTIKVLCDNVAAVSYVTKMGGRTDHMSQIAHELVDWCATRNIRLLVQHLPGVDNTKADRLSRWQNDRSDWRLDPEVFARLESIWAAPHGFSVDLFATRVNKLKSRFASWFYDPEATWVDAFAHDWSNETAYANPPHACILKVLQKARNEAVRLVLIAPCWQAQPWWPVLLDSLIAPPMLLPPQSMQYTPVNSSVTGRQSRASSQNWPVCAWLISGNSQQSVAFRRALSRELFARGPIRQLDDTMRLGNAGSLSAHVSGLMHDILHQLCWLTT